MAGPLQGQCIAILENYEDENEDNEFDILVDALTSLDNKLGSIDMNTRVCESEVHTVIRPGNDITIVNLQISISSVDDIDTVRQEFSCEFHLTVTWEEPLFKSVEGDSEIEWSKYWDPRVCFLNAVDIMHMTSSHKMIKTPGNLNPVVQLSYRVKGRFRSLFDLQNFPFDYQKLQIKVTSKWGDSVVEFKECSCKPATLSCKTFLSAHEWQLYKHVIGVPSCTADDCTDDHAIEEIASTDAPHCRNRIAKGSTLDPAANRQFLADNNNSKERPLVFSMFTFSFSIRRKFCFFVSNVIAMMILISFLALAPFCVAQSEVGDRLSIIFTLLLTAVTFKFVVSQSLPIVAYQTLLDQYVLACMSYIFVLTIIIGITNKVGLFNYEQVTVAVCAGTWFIMTLGIICLSVMKVKRSVAALERMERAYEVRRGHFNVRSSIVNATMADHFFKPVASPEDIPMRKSESAPPGDAIILSGRRANSFRDETCDNASHTRQRQTRTNARLQARKNKLKKRRVYEKTQDQPGPQGSQRQPNSGPQGSQQYKKLKSQENRLKSIEEVSGLNNTFSGLDDGSDEEIVMATLSLDKYNDEVYNPVHLSSNRHACTRFFDGGVEPLLHTTSIPEASAVPKDNAMLLYKDETDSRGFSVSVNPNCSSYKDGGVLFKAGLITDQMVADIIACQQRHATMPEDQDNRLSKKTELS